MKPEVKRDILNILEGVNVSFDKYNADAIMEWSNHIIHSASIHQEKHTSLVAIVVYSIGKVMAKGKIRRYPQEVWNAFETTVRNELPKAINHLKTDAHKKFDRSLLILQKAVMNLDESYMDFADHVVDRAKLKKAAKVFEHGVSLSRVAELFGVSEWELRSYAGKSRIFERVAEKSNVKKRLDKIRGFFA